MNLKQVLSLSSILLLSACHEDYLAGVSLGGTGTGDDRSLPTFPPPIEPDPADQPDNPVTPPTSEPVPTIVYPDAVVQNCQGIQRTLSFIDPYTNELKPVNSHQSLIPEFNMPNDIALSLEVCNTTSHQVYEYIPECQSPLQLIDEYNESVPTLTSPYLCQGEEALHLYNPNQCKTYILNSSIRTVIQNWRLRYSAQYSFDTFKNTDQRTQCDAIETTLPVIYMEGDNTSQDNDNSDNTDQPQTPISITPI